MLVYSSCCVLSTFYLKMQILLFGEISCIIYFRIVWPTILPFSYSACTELLLFRYWINPLIFFFFFFCLIFFYWDIFLLFCNCLIEFIATTIFFKYQELFLFCEVLVLLYKCNIISPNSVPLTINFMYVWVCM